MGNRGGRRPGAGRKKGGKNRSTILAGEAKRKLIEKVLAVWEPLIDAKIDLALGEYWVEDKEKGKVYLAKPDGSAINDLVTFVIGKPDKELPLPPGESAVEVLAEKIQGILGSARPIQLNQVNNYSMPEPKPQPVEVVEAKQIEPPPPPVQQPQPVPQPATPQPEPTFHFPKVENMPVPGEKPTIQSVPFNPANVLGGSQ